MLHQSPTGNRLNYLAQLEASHLCSGAHSIFEHHYPRSIGTLYVLGFVDKNSSRINGPTAPRSLMAYDPIHAAF